MRMSDIWPPQVSRSPANHLKVVMVLNGVASLLGRASGQDLNHLMWCLVTSAWLPVGLTAFYHLNTLHPSVLRISRSLSIIKSQIAPLPLLCGEFEWAFL